MFKNQLTEKLSFICKIISENLNFIKRKAMSLNDGLVLHRQKAFRQYAKIFLANRGRGEISPLHPSPNRCIGLKYKNIHHANMQSQV